MKFGCDMRISRLLEVTSITKNSLNYTSVLWILGYAWRLIQCILASTLNFVVCDIYSASPSNVYLNSNYAPCFNSFEMQWYQFFFMIVLPVIQQLTTLKLVLMIYSVYYANCENWCNEKNPSRKWQLHCCIYLLKNKQMSKKSACFVCIY